MPAYHSKNNDYQGNEACGCLMLPIKTTVRGTAPPCEADDEDIIDETLKFFRANIFFRNFEVKGGADRTLLYLSLYVAQVLKELDRQNDKTQAAKDLHALEIKSFPVPGEQGWTLGGMFPNPTSPADADAFRAYFKQCKVEIGRRVLEILYLPDGTKNKWWNMFAKRKFMGKTL